MQNLKFEILFAIANPFLSHYKNDVRICTTYIFQPVYLFKVASMFNVLEVTTQVSEAFYHGLKVVLDKWAPGRYAAERDVTENKW